MKFNRVLIIGFLLFLFICSSALAAGINYKDLPQNHWAFQAVQNLTQQGIVKGFPDNSFRPNLTVTREQFAIILVNTFQFPLDNKACQTFSDIGLNHRSFLYIDAAKSFIPVNNPLGYNFNFYANKAITREEFAYAITNALKLDKAQKPGPNYLSSKYKDYQSISARYRSNVAMAVYYGIMSGGSDGKFRAKAGINRAELCVVINNLQLKGPVIDAGLKPPRKPWTIEFVNFQRPDYEKVRDFPGYNMTQAFYGKVVSKVKGFNNSHLVVTHQSVKEDDDGVYGLVRGKTVRIYLSDQDLNLFNEGEWVKFYYDRDNNVTSHTKDL